MTPAHRAAPRPGAATAPRRRVVRETPARRVRHARREIRPTARAPAAQIEVVAAARLEAIGDPPYPNWTAVGVNWPAGFDFEIKVVARIPAAA